jgi:glycerate kinase
MLRAMRVLVCPDKFRGTLTAREAAEAMAGGARDAGWEPVVVPLADGGEGMLEAFGGATTTTVVTGPLGQSVDAAWRLVGSAAVIEMARASGLVVAGGASGNDPLGASTRGTGELIAAAVALGARDIVVGVGGSATTDGGAGAVEVLESLAPLDGSLGYRVTVACDVRTRFLDAARVFAPQKGATPGQVVELTRRLESIAEDYLLRYAVDVRELDHAGAAGGLAGGLAALGARLTSGFDAVADAVGLRVAMTSADHVLTGEGRLDAGSFDGKVVGGVVAMAERVGVPASVIAGQSLLESPCRVPTIDLVLEFGRDAAIRWAAQSVRQAARRLLAVRE